MQELKSCPICGQKPQVKTYTSGEFSVGCLGPNPGWTDHYLSSQILPDLESAERDWELQVDRVIARRNAKKEAECWTEKCLVEAWNRRAEEAAE